MTWHQDKKMVRESSLVENELLLSRLVPSHGSVDFLCILDTLVASSGLGPSIPCREEPTDGHHMCWFQSSGALEGYELYLPYPHFPVTPPWVWNTPGQLQAFGST